MTTIIDADDLARAVRYLLKMRLKELNGRAAPLEYDERVQNDREIVGVQELLRRLGASQD